MQAIENVRSLSRWLLLLTNVALLVLPLASLSWMTAIILDPSLASHLVSGLPEVTVFSRVKAVMLALLAAAALAPTIYALWHMRQLFSRYRAGDVLTPEAALNIRQIGMAIMTIGAIAALIPSLQGLILTADNPAGQKVLAVSLSSDVFGLFLAGGLLTVIGWAMTEAARAAAENESFV